MGHQRPNQNHTATFHPFETKSNKKKQLGDREMLSQWVFVFSTSWSPNSNMRERSQRKHGQRDSREGREEEAREESLEENERRGVQLSSHTFQESDSLYTHTHEINTLASQSNCEKQTSHNWCQDTSAGLNKMYCKISGLQHFSKWLDAPTTGLFLRYFSSMSNLRKSNCWQCQFSLGRDIFHFYSCNIDEIENITESRRNLQGWSKKLFSSFIQVSPGKRKPTK